MFRSKKQQVKNTTVKSLGIKTGDTVLVISGEGKSDQPRKVLSVLPKSNQVIVEGVNVVKDHQKQRPQSGRASGINEGGIVEKPMPIDRSKVALIDPKTKKATRIKFRTEADGTKTRVSVKSGETL